MTRMFLFFHLSAQTPANGEKIILTTATVDKIALTAATPPISVAADQRIEIVKIAVPALETSLPTNKSKKFLFLVKRFKLPLEPDILFLFSFFNL
ncbi:hypothetical protein HWHPT5561_03260 [Petrotoga sp. HWH.PT.55.6.1]|nr:hypothetical protein HWHPT5561_03260 [Petrotoga sp. HWH.PT.55.6.1]